MKIQNGNLASKVILLVLICIAFTGELALAQKPLAVRANEYGGTTFTYPDKYGGTRDDSFDIQGRLRERVWKHGEIVLSREKTTYDKEGGKEVITTVFDNKGVFSVTTVKTDLKGNEVSRDEQIRYRKEDTRYGEKGERVDYRDVNSGRTVATIWKDNKGRVMEEETTVYGTEDQKTVSTTIYNPLPNGDLRPGTVTTVKSDRKGNEVLRETKLFNPKSEQIGGTRTELDPKGGRKTFRWNPRQKDYVEDTDSTSSPTSGGVSSSSPVRGFSVASEVSGGLSVATFTTPQGTIYVNLPSDMAAGDTLSGTVVAEPKGEDPKQRAKHERELSEYVVELASLRHAVSAGRILSLALPPATSTTTFLILRDKKGKEVGRSEVPVASSLSTIGDFKLPTLGQQGHAIEVLGIFDGKFETTRIQIGGQDMQLLAESPRRLFFRNTSEHVGLNEIECREGNQSRQGRFRSLGIKLSAPKLNLLRGEGTILTILVTGLEDLRESIPLEIENRSPGVISMGGGNSQLVMISPGEVRQGSYTTTRPLTGIEPGGFTITATVTRRDGEDQAQTPPEVIARPNSGPQTAAGGTPGYNICGSGCGQPANEQGTGRIRCVTSATCAGRGADCKCHLFRRPRNSNQDYDHVEGPNAWTDPEGGYEYVCRCVN